MQRLIIKGNKLSGIKNFWIKYLFLLQQRTNCIPVVKDVITMSQLLKHIGSDIKVNLKKKKILINNRNSLKTLAPYSFLKTMRAGVIVLGPLLSKFGKAKVSLPGGCAIGTRPVDIHLFGLKKLGAKIKIKNGYIQAEAKKGLIGTKIKLPKISVGATENLIIAACYANGTTLIKNCACEPEIKDLTTFLQKMGANIKWIKKREIRIIGCTKFKPVSHSVMFDRIEAGTFIIAGALIAKKLKIVSIKTKVIKKELQILKKIGVRFKVKKNKLNSVSINRGYQVSPFRHKLWC